MEGLGEERPRGCRTAWRASGARISCAVASLTTHGDDWTEEGRTNTGFVRLEGTRKGVGTVILGCR